MLHFFPPGLAEQYFLFTFVTALGILQLVAAHYHWAGLSLPGQQRGRWGYVLGVSLLGAAYLWFFWAVQPLIFVPGLAGAELATLSAISTIMALGMTLTLASLLHRRRVRVEPRGERVDFDLGRGRVQQSAHTTDGHPAAIIVSDLPDGDFPTSRLADQLTDRGFFTVRVDLADDGPVGYPEILARLPAICAYLQNQPGAVGRGALVIGAGIGGDLALRAAATDPAILGVTAIDPVLDSEARGLDRLRRVTFWEALRWGGLRRRLAQALAAVDRLPQLRDRPALLVYRTNPIPVTEVASREIDVVVVRTDGEAVQRVVSWAAEVMDRRANVA